MINFILQLRMHISPYSYRNIHLTERELFQMNIILLVLLILVLSGITIVFYRYSTKGKTNKKKLKKLYPNDIFWDSEKITDYAKKYYVEFYSHWNNNNLEPIKDSMRKNCFSFFQKTLSRYERNGLKNLITEISITRVAIISIKDYIDDSKDQVSLLIEGSCKDYFYPRETDTKKENFKDIFTFIRVNNELILCDINYDPDYMSTAFEKNYIEKSK